MSRIAKVVLAYSGGLDTSVAVRWIAERYQCEIVTFCADVGQDEDLEAARQKALAVGAKKAVVRDLRREFVRDYVFPALRAGAIYEDGYLMGTALARPCIAAALVEVARAEGTDTIAHGATGKGNDQVRFELTAHYFMPGVRVIAPWREWEFTGRTQLIAYSQEHKIPIDATPEKPYSIDRNLLHNSIEGGLLEDPWNEPSDDVFELTRAPEQAPDTPRYVEIEFAAGNPVALDGETLQPDELLARLNQIAGEHGVGRVDIVENRMVGLKSRGVYETPGGTVLHVARRAVESITLDREAMHLRDDLSSRYASLVYNGLWFSPEREALQSLVDEMARQVNGTARVKLYKGSAITVGRKSDQSLYRADLATFDDETPYNHADAGGFIRTTALRLRIHSEQKQRAASGK
ncbi:MAG: argininosuccinate synthase [Proteobacteria bacterium]|nr:argininosuccinate synthase [Pseudomonadota bacterium]